MVPKGAAVLANSSAIETQNPEGIETMPPPEALFLQAERETDNRTLGQYVDSIRVLRDKSFSYREIAEWLSKRGVEADHNAVYRVHMKSLSDYDAHLEAQREEDEARDEADRNR